MADYSKMTLDELAEARIVLDNQMQALREEKGRIQAEVNRRRPGNLPAAGAIIKPVSVVHKRSTDKKGGD